MWGTTNRGNNWYAIDWRTHRRKLAGPVRSTGANHLDTARKWAIEYNIRDYGEKVIVTQSGNKYDDSGNFIEVHKDGEVKADIR